MTAEASEPPTPEPEQYSPEVVDRMAAEMPPRQGVWWACQSCRQVASQLQPADFQAMEAAEQWVKRPESGGAASAVAVLENSDFQGPGAWAAQAAVWAQRGAQAVAMESGSMASLAPKAIAGAVKLAAAMSAGQVPSWDPAASAEAIPAEEPTAASESTAMEGAASTPPEASQAAKALKPFIELGQAIASNASPWA